MNLSTIPGTWSQIFLLPVLLATQSSVGPRSRNHPAPPHSPPPAPSMIYCPGEATTLAKPTSLEASGTGALARSPSVWAAPGRLTHQFLSPDEQSHGRSREKGERPGPG